MVGLANIATDDRYSNGPSVSSINRAASTNETTNGTTLTYTVTFSQAVTGVTSDDFQFSKTDTADGTIGTPTTSDGGLTWSVQLLASSATAPYAPRSQIKRHRHPK